MNEETAKRLAGNNEPGTEELLPAGESRADRVIGRIEESVVVALRALIMLLVVAATVVLFVLFVTALPSQIRQTSTASGLLGIMQASFAGVLGVVLGLEVSETLKIYFTHHEVRLEVILIIATIAVSRHLIQVDYEHTSATVLLGLAILILCLTIGYLLVKKANLSVPSGGGNRTG